MGLARISTWFTLLLTWAALVLCLGAEGDGAVAKVRILKAPKAVSNSKSAAFELEVVGCRNCSSRCKLDGYTFTTCEGKEVSYTGLPDGKHKFEVCINGPQGANCDIYSWIVDTVPPTASISAASPFTSALNVSVNVSFSEPCTVGGGFQCSRKDCNLLVYGAGNVIPSTLKVLQPNIMYSLSVNISPEVLYGRIVLVMGRGFCTDIAGNRFSRTTDSRFFLHFDKRSVSVVTGTPIPKSLLPLNNVVREVEATNDDRNLKIYLQFSQPVLNSSAEILMVLHTSTGVLLPTNRRNLGNRRFGFLVKNIPNIAIITVHLETSFIISRYGSPVSPVDPRTFLYDVERPSVKLSTPKLRTREHTVPVIIKFVKPVFNFNASALQISGGHLIGFQKISRNIYTAGIQLVETTVAITIPDSIASDVAGNKNLASNLLLVHHYPVPMVSNVLSIVTSIIFGVTAFVAILLTVSTATLLAFGALTRSPSYFASEPSRNIMRIVYHIQVFAQSKWLPVNLPVEYYEFVRGIQWSIPYLNLPWETKNLDFSSVDVNSSTEKYLEASEREQLLMSQFLPITKGEFKLNTPQHGAPLTPMEYMSFFEGQNLKPQAEFIGTSRNSHRWKEFEHNMLWLAVIGGSLILLHALILLIIKLRRKNSETNKSYGALVVPRFEIFLIFLALPSICQASATIIRGKSTGGLIIGSLHLAIVSFFLIFLLLFFSIGITMGKLLLYKEVHRGGRELHWYQGIVCSSLGPGKRGQWTWKGHPESTLLTRLGPLFEDLRGPPNYMLSQITAKESTSKRAESIIASNDKMEGAEVSFLQKLFGILRIYYTLLDSVKRVSLGIIAGAYAGRRTNKKPILIVLCITSFQLFFLALNKPFIKRKVQLVELVSSSAEAGVFAACLVFFRDLSEAQQKSTGYFMLALFVIMFAVGMINEWYALYRQVLRLSPGEDSFLWGLKTVVIGLLLTFFPPKLVGLDGRLSSDRGEGESRSSMSSGRQKENNSGGNERSWIRQLREIARESFSRDNAKDPSSSRQKQRSGSSSISSSSEFRAKTRALQKDLQGIFSSK